MCFCPNFGRTDEGGNEKQEISLVWPNEVVILLAYVGIQSLRITVLSGLQQPGGTGSLGEHVTIRLMVWLLPLVQNVKI